jgi:hypothetical protein
MYNYINLKPLLLAFATSGIEVVDKVDSVYGIPLSYATEAGMVSPSGVAYN